MDRRSFLKIAGLGAIAASGSGSLIGNAWSAEDFDRLRGLITPVMAKKPYRVAFSAVHFIDQYWKGVAYGIVDEAKRSNVEVVRILSAGGYGKLASQISQLETLQALNLDAVIIGAVSFDGLKRPLKQLADNGTKVVAMDLTVNSPDVSLRVGQDQAAVGEAIGNYVCKQDPKAQMITLPGPAGVEWSAQRLDGLKKAAAECGGMKLFGNTLKGGTAVEDGMSQASDFLIKYPDANYVYAAVDNLGVGAAEAIKSAGKKGKIKVVTSSVTDKTVDLMHEGLIEMVISEPSVLLGRVTLQYTIRLLNGDPLPNLAKVGGLPYPSMDLPPKPLTLDVLEHYDLNWYDVPPQGWQPSL
jgi:ribose transport system substrate-binding protein